MFSNDKVIKWSKCAWNCAQLENVCVVKHKINLKFTFTLYVCNVFFRFFYMTLEFREKKVGKITVKMPYADKHSSRESPFLHRTQRKRVLKTFHLDRVPDCVCFS